MNQKMELFFSELTKSFKNIKEGGEVKIQIMRTGSRDHQRYGKVQITSEDLKEFKKNFEANKRGIDLVVDENHEGNHRALGVFKKLFFKGKNTLHAVIEITGLGAELLSKGAYKYFSPEFHRISKNEETGEIIKNLLVGGAFTNRPFFKLMSPLLASEDESTRNQTDGNTFYYFSGELPMKTIKSILAAFHDTGAISAEDQETLKQKYSELDEQDVTPRMVAQVEEAIQFSEEEDGDDADDSDEGEEEGSDEGDDSSEEDDADGEGEEEEESEDGDDEGSEEDEDGDDDKGEGDDGQKHSEDEVSIKASEFERLQNVEKQLIAAEVTKKLESFAFSEKGNSGSVVPKAMKSAKEFALMLSEPLLHAFYGFLKANSISTELFGEIGHSDENPLKGLKGEALLDRKIELYCEEHKLDSDKDYDIALKAVTASEAQD